jgi:hypothetical protein
MGVYVCWNHQSHLPKACRYNAVTKASMFQLVSCMKLRYRTRVPMGGRFRWGVFHFDFLRWWRLALSAFRISRHRFLKLHVLGRLVPRGKCGWRLEHGLRVGGILGGALRRRAALFVFNGGFRADWMREWDGAHKAGARIITGHG